jgi:hypothetical protein
MVLGQHTLAIALTVFVMVLGCMFLGRWLRARLPEGTEFKTGSIDGAVYALVGLLIGFTFNGAAERFQRRRELIIDEVNAISTAYSRVDLVQADRQGDMRAAFRAYVEARLAVYANPDDRELTRTRLAQQEEKTQALWKQVVDSLEAPGAVNPLALVVPVNEMFDMASTRVNVTLLHPPPVIYVLLTLACLVAGVLVGFGLQAQVRLVLHMLIYASVMATTLFVILELEYPRLGVVRVDDADTALVELLATMKR